MTRTLLAYLRQFWAVHLLAVLAMTVVSVGVLSAVLDASPPQLRPVGGQADWVPGVVARAVTAGDSLEAQWEQIASMLPPGAQGLAVRAIPSGDRFVVAGRDVRLSPAEVDFTDPHLNRVLELTAGALPRQRGEVVVSESAARSQHLAIGTVLPRPVEKYSARRLQDLPGLSVTGIVRQRFTDVVPGIERDSWMYGQTGTLLAPRPPAKDESRVSWVVAANAPISWADVVTANANGVTIQSRAVMAHPPRCSQLNADYRRPQVNVAELGLDHPCAAQNAARQLWHGLPRLGANCPALLVMTLMLGSTLMAPTGSRRRDSIEQRAAAAGSPLARPYRPLILVGLAAVGISVAGLVLMGALFAVPLVVVWYAGASDELYLDTLWRPVLIVLITIGLGLLAAWPADVLARSRFSPPLALRWLFAVAAVAPLVGVVHLLNVDTYSWGRLVEMKILTWLGLAVGLIVLAVLARRYPSAIAWRQAWLPVLTTLIPLTAGLAGLAWTGLHQLAPSLGGEAGARLASPSAVPFGVVGLVALVLWGLMLLVIHREHLVLPSREKA